MAFDLGRAAFGSGFVSKLDKTVKQIPLNKIHVNNANFYSIEKIEELAESIRMVGLLSPVNVVEAAGGTYRLISGHRRFEAYKILRGDGLCDGAEKTGYDYIPAIVVAGLDDLTETVALVTANSTARELTYAERCKQEQTLRETLLAMKEAGREVPKNLGQYIADHIGVSRNEVSRMHSVNENLIPEAREELEAGRLTAQQAYDLSRKSADEQAAQINPEQSTPKLDSNTDVLAKMGLIWSVLKHRLLRGAVGLDRKSGIECLKHALRNNGGLEGGVMWSAAGNKFSIRPLDPNLPDVDLKYSELWDWIASQAIRELATEYASPSTSDGWQQGEPPAAGEYACRYRINQNIYVRVLDWDEAGWLFQGSSNRVSDAVEILGWVQLPKEDGR